MEDLFTAGYEDMKALADTILEVGNSPHPKDPEIGIQSVVMAELAFICLRTHFYYRDVKEKTPMGYETIALSWKNFTNIVALYTRAVDIDFYWFMGAVLYSF